MKRILLVLVLIVLLLPLALLFLLSERPNLQWTRDVAVIGTATPAGVEIIDTHGVRRAAAFVEQNGTRYPVFEKNQAAHRFWFWRAQRPLRVDLTAGTKTAPALKDGSARLIVEATSNDFRGATATLARDVRVVTRPPSLAADGNQHYINQGGCELVTFSVSGYAESSGVRVGKYSFRSFPVPGKPNQFFSLFAYPWDLDANVVPLVFATDPAGDDVTARFWYKLFPKKFRVRDLAIDDAFLQRVVPQIDPSGSGDLLQRFLHINSAMRQENNKTLADLRFKSEPRFLWTGPFLQLANSKVESQFADVRNYIYKGKKVDQQVHLGFDLSVTQHVPVIAANDGRIVWAQNLGIYGNCIVVDHGYGLQSIYGHLSQIDVKPGDMVKRGQSMGRSGSTGLAGGDHVHFSMQLDGVQVNPVEWWDAHWIHDRIVSKIQ